MLVRSPVSGRSMQSYILTYYRFGKKEPLIALGAPHQEEEGGSLISASAVGRYPVFNAQSIVSVISGRNTIHLITCHSLLTVPDISQYLFGEVLEKMT